MIEPDVISVSDPFLFHKDPRRMRAFARKARVERQRLREAELGAQTTAFKNRETNQKLEDWASEVTRNTFSWVTEHTETYNEHWVEEGRPSPYEKFPRYDYFRHLFDLFAYERITWIEKSRDMMVSWAAVAHLTLAAQKVPLRGVLFQTQKEDKVIQLVDYAKCLWDRQDPRLKEQYPLSKPLLSQPQTELRFANGSYIKGIPGGADQIRSYHPWGYLNDESSFQPEAGECYNEALAVVKGCIIFNSSAGPGWYADARHDIIRNEDD